MSEEKIILYMVYSNYRSAHLTSAEYIKEEKGIFVEWRMNKNYITSRDIMPYRIETQYKMENRRIGLTPKEAWDNYIKDLESNVNWLEKKIETKRQNYFKSEKLLRHAKRKREKLNDK